MRPLKRAGAYIEILKLFDGWMGKYHKIRLISVNGFKIPKKYQLRKRK